MNDDLDSLLAACARQPRPDASAAPTAAEVWREIGRHRARSPWARLSSMADWRDAVLDARVAAAALVFAALVGAVPALVAGHAENERRLARQSIHFEVFSPGTLVLGSAPAGREAGGPVFTP